MDRFRKVTTLLLLAATAMLGGCSIFAKPKPSSFVLTPPDAALDIAAATKPPTSARRVVDGFEKTVIAIAEATGDVLYHTLDIWSKIEE